jgi:hypothetical protein
MHGVTISLGNGTKGELRAGYANRERRLEVKILITFHDLEKPLMVPVCMFLTALQPAPHCEATLLQSGRDQLPDEWSEPIELRADGKLGLIR